MQCQHLDRRERRTMTRPERPGGPFDEDSLVRRLQRRDKTAFAELLDRHGAAMYRVARTFTHDEAGAEQVMRDALIAVREKIGSFAGHASLGTWLPRVVLHAALWRLRKQTNARRLVWLVGLRALRRLLGRDDTPRPGVPLVRGKLADAVQHGLDALPEPDRMTVILSDVEELPISAIAEATDSTEAVVQWRLHRARLALRRMLLPYLQALPSTRDLDGRETRLHPHSSLSHLLEVES